MADESPVKSTEQLAFESAVATLRADILDIEKRIQVLAVDPFLKTAPTPENVDAGEAIANVKLAYRHAEDARMRLGKVFQALSGGVSSYAK